MTYMSRPPAGYYRTMSTGTCTSTKACARATYYSGCPTCSQMTEYGTMNEYDYQYRSGYYYYAYYYYYYYSYYYSSYYSTSVSGPFRVR